MNTVRPAPIRDPKWVWFGCSIRYNAKTVSVLAILETVAASVLALYATFHWGASKWFALYLGISPLLLLKTKGSVRKGLKWWVAAAGGTVRWILKVTGRTPNWVEGVIWLVLAMPITLLIAIIAIPLKVAATLQAMLAGPQLSGSRLARNWWEQCLQKDLSALPELLPGAERVSDARLAGARFGSLRTMVGMLRSDEGPTVMLFGTWLLSPFLAAIIFFGLGYRWCLKATAGFWVLLLFFSRPLRRKNDTLDWRTEDILTHRGNMVLRLWGVVVIVMHGVVPLVFRQGYGKWVAWLHELEPQMQHLIRFFLVERGWENGFPLAAWHVAGVVSAALTWVLWWIGQAGRIALRPGRLSPAEQEASRRKIVGIMWVRALLATYTVFCGLVAAARTLHWSMPEVLWLP